MYKRKFNSPFSAACSQPLPRSRATIPRSSISAESLTLAAFSTPVPRAGGGAYSVFYSATNCLHLKCITVSQSSSASCPDARFCMKGHSGGGAGGERGHSLPNDSFKSLTPALSAGRCQVVTLRSEEGQAGTGASAEWWREVRAVVRSGRGWTSCTHVPTHP